MYLPQYHSIPENDLYWGKGFTDWVTVKKAQPLYKGHNQPRIPLHNRYYDLSNKEDVAWQVNLAKEYGISGFGIYHYWFNNDKNLLTTPARIILENNNLDINYFYAWDNISWKRSWSNVEGNSWAPSLEKSKPKHKGPAILIPYILGEKADWENHFNYLLPFFQDPRYEKKDNMPIFCIFHYDAKIAQMCDYWNVLARRNGFNGIFFIFRFDSSLEIDPKFSYFKYEPQFSGWSHASLFNRVINKFKRLLKVPPHLKRYNYDDIWQSILTNAKSMPQPNIYQGAFVTYDDSPRRGNRGIEVYGSSPEKFMGYMSRLRDIAQSQKKEYIFLTAWNEWGEGAYLEPDSMNKYNYLSVIKKIMSEDNE